MTKMVKKLAALIMSTLILSVLFATSAFAQENRAMDINEEEILKEIVSHLENGVTIDVVPNEVKQIEIPLSNGKSACLEIGCAPITLTRGSTSASYNYNSNGDYVFWGNIKYDYIGSYSHRVNFKITALSPTCEFYITSASVESQQPSIGHINSGAGVTENKNYSVKTSSYSKAYASFSINGYANNVYSKILMNSMNPNKITFTVYYSLTPID